MGISSKNTLPISTFKCMLSHFSFVSVQFTSKISVQRTFRKFLVGTDHHPLQNSCRRPLVNTWLETSEWSLRVIPSPIALCIPTIPTLVNTISILEEGNRLTLFPNGNKVKPKGHTPSSVVTKKGAHWWEGISASSHRNMCDTMVNIMWWHLIQQDWTAQPLVMSLKDSRHIKVCSTTDRLSFHLRHAWLLNARAGKTLHFSKGISCHYGL